MDKLLFGFEEAAIAVDLSPWTLRAMARDGRLRTVKLSRRRMIPRAELERIAERGLPGPRAKTQRGGSDE